MISAKKPRPWGELLHYRAATLESGVRVRAPDGTDFQLDADLAALLDELAARFGRPLTIEAAGTLEAPHYESEWPAIDGISVSGNRTTPTNVAGRASPFVDLGAVHLMTTITVDAVGALVSPSTVDARRFRPNVLIEPDDAGTEAFIENGWSEATVRVGSELELRIDKPTARCIMTTLDQPGVEREPGVLRALAAANRVTTDTGSFAMLGAYASVLHGGTIRTGDPVSVETA